MAKATPTARRKGSAREKRAKPRGRPRRTLERRLGRRTARRRTAWTARPWVQPSARSEEGRLGAQARTQEQPRRFRAATRSRPDRDPGAAGGRQASRSGPAAPRADGGIAVRLLPRNTGGDGVRSRHHAAHAGSSCRRAAMRISPTSASSLLPSGASCSMPTTSTRRMAGPWEWDVKRLAASVVIAGRANGFNAAQNRVATMAAVRSYREWMARYAQMRADRRLVLVHHRRRDRARPERPHSPGSRASARRRGTIDKLFSKARGRDQMRAASQLTTVVDGRRKIVLDPPIIQRVKIPGGPGRCARSSRTTARR